MQLRLSPAVLIRLLIGSPAVTANANLVWSFTAPLGAAIGAENVGGARTRRRAVVPRPQRTGRPRRLGIPTLTPCPSRPIFAGALAVIRSPA